MKLKVITLCILLILTIYQDFPLVNYFGEIARSPIVFLAPFFLGYLMLYKRLNISNYTKIYFIYLCYLIFISAIYTFVVIIKNESIYILGENILIKNLKMLTYPFITLLFYQFIYTLFYVEKLNFNDLFRALFFIQIFLILLLIFEATVYKTTEVFLPFLHSSNEKYWRIRFLTYESSWTGTIVVIFTLLPIYFVNSLKKKMSIRILVFITSAFFFLYYTIHSESKGYLILVLIAVLPMLVKQVYKNRKYRKYFYTSLILIITVGVIIFEPLKEEVYKQFNSSITFGTRFSSYLASIQTFVKNPFGIGLGAYLDIYVANLRSVIDLNIMQQFNLSEIKEYLHSSKFLSSKTYFFDHLVFAGIPFLIFFYLFFIKRYQRLSKFKEIYLIKIILVFIVLSSVTYITLNIKYEVWFFLAIIDVIEKNKQLEES